MISRTKKVGVYRAWIVFILGLVVLTGLFCSVFVSAITYQQEVDVAFTFNSGLRLTVSADLNIFNLAPGTSEDSNIINVNVLTNNLTGYNLTATVGNTTYNNRYLTNTADSTERFDSISFGSSLASLTTPNTWGYSYSTNNGSSWSNYNGLPLYTDTTNIATLKSTNGPAGANGDDVKFKINAYADTDQPAGQYKNVINFKLVANAVAMTIDDVEYMQEFGDMDSTDKTSVLNSMISNTQYQLTDSRDGKIYYVAKLADGNVWMTQNLDHNIGDIDGGVYDSDNTDIPEYWEPDVSEYTYTDYLGWHDDYGAIESYDPGNMCWNGDYPATYDLNCTQEGSHYHLGNFYNWTAAVAMSDSYEIVTGGEDVDQSICPAGWTLPKSGTSDFGSGSFYYLLNQAGLNAYNIADDPVYFVYSGYYISSWQYTGEEGLYWSSVIESVSGAYNFYFDTGHTIDPYGASLRYRGLSVRCVLR